MNKIVSYFISVAIKLALGDRNGLIIELLNELIV